MEYLIVIVLCILTILILKIGMNIKIKDIKKIKEMANNEELTKLSNEFPENKNICKEILKMLENEDVQIEETENSQTSLYLVIQNKILIGKIKDSFTRIQTIVHECIHSVQNKALLKFNFIFSNINIFYFVVICILAIFKVTNKNVENLLLIGLILIQLIFFAVRSFLETDAMTRAEYLTKEYIEKNKILNEENENSIMSKYKELNKIGIKLYNFMLAVQSLVKPIVYCILLIIF